MDLKSNVRKDVPVRLWIGPPFNNNKFIVIDLLLLKGIIEKDYIDLLIAWTLVRIQPFNIVECSSEVEHGAHNPRVAGSIPAAGAKLGV